jgi:hypothetical protein
MYDPKVGRWLSEDPLGFRAGDTNLSRYVSNNPVNMVDPSGLAGHTVSLGGGEATAYVEWFPDKGVAEMKVMSKAGEELARFRWSKVNPKVIEMILSHGGKPLPGIPQSLMEKTCNNITDQLKIMINRAGGEYSRPMIPPPVKAGYPKGGNKGIGNFAKGTLIGLVIGQVLQDLSNAKANAGELPSLKVMPNVLPLIHPDDIEIFPDGRARLKPGARITGYQVTTEEGMELIIRP